MTKEGSNGFLGVFLAGFAKRMLENKYDKLAKTQLIESLKQLPMSGKLTIEGVLNALNALFEKYFPENTELRKFTKEVASDFTSEISKRIINGSAQEKELAATLLSLEPGSLRQLLDWMTSTPPAERRQIIRLISQRPIAEIERLAQLPPEYLTLFFQLTQPEKPAEGPDHLEPIKRRLQGYIDRKHKEKGGKP